MTPMQIHNIVEELAHPAAIRIMEAIGIGSSQGHPHYWPIRREVTVALREALQRATPEQP